MTFEKPKSDIVPKLTDATPRLRQGQPLVCLSHLRWDLVFQRPQHLMTRFARETPVYFLEEPIFDTGRALNLSHRCVEENLTVLVPELPAGITEAEVAFAQTTLLTNFLSCTGVRAPVLWFYTPAAWQFADTLPAAVTVYDCMDELTGFQGASPKLRELEADLLERADIVFTGGMSLYEAKQGLHHNVHAFPSAVDAGHFARARHSLEDPADQAAIPHPRLGFFGVIDERLDRDLVSAVARLRPDWQLIFIGPVAKIDPASLPRASNIHYLGRKTYVELPSYVAKWDVAMMPFALNEATRFISPTKTPEYLAAGKPVVSTPIKDVVRGWGHLEPVRIAATPGQFITEATFALSLPERAPGWLELVDLELEQLSWDRTWERMTALINAALARKDMTAMRPYPAAAGAENPLLGAKGGAHV